MELQKLTGSGSGVVKYDLLTALSVAGLNGPPGLQTSMLRLIALVTARYNWRHDEFTVGQRDMARMWSVNERTVKREIKRLVETGILICTRQGVKGRVGAYRLNYPRIAELSENSWQLVGPDFDDRMRARYGNTRSKVVALQSYKSSFETPATSSGNGTWATVMARLAHDDAGLHQSWFSKLSFVDHADRVLSLKAPSYFVQRYIETHHLPKLLAAVEHDLGIIDRIVFV